VERRQLIRLLKKETLFDCGATGIDMGKLPLVPNDLQEIQVLDSSPMAIPLVEEDYLFVSTLPCCAKRTTFLSRRSWKYVLPRIVRRCRLRRLFSDAHIVLLQVHLWRAPLSLLRSLISLRVIHLEVGVTEEPNLKRMKW
jgi:hypothetical protein